VGAYSSEPGADSGAGRGAEPDGVVDAEGMPEAGTATPPARTPTRASAGWTAVVIGLVVLILLVIFIAQNTQQASINFLGAHARWPTSAVILVAAAAGAAVAVVAGVARILELRRGARKR